MLIVLVGSIQLVLLVATRRDIRRRPASEITAASGGGWRSPS
jgi:hypothetical protein